MPLEFDEKSFEKGAQSEKVRQEVREHSPDIVLVGDGYDKVVRQLDGLLERLDSAPDEPVKARDLLRVIRLMRAENMGRDALAVQTERMQSLWLKAQGKQQEPEEVEF